MTNTQLDHNLRQKIIEEITDLLTNYYKTDVMPVKKFGTVCFPVLDEEYNEKFIEVSISVPRGMRNGKGSYVPFDGYAAAEEYAETMRIKEEERAEQLAENQRQVELAKQKAKRKYTKKEKESA